MIEVEDVAGIHFGLGADGGELAQRHAAFGLQADIDDHEIIVDPQHAAGDDGAFEPGGTAERGIQEGGEIIGAGISRRVGMTLSNGEGSHVAGYVLENEPVCGPVWVCAA